MPDTGNDLQLLGQRAARAVFDYVGEVLNLKPGQQIDGDMAGTLGTVLTYVIAYIDAYLRMTMPDVNIAGIRNVSVLMSDSLVSHIAQQKSGDVKGKEN